MSEIDPRLREHIAVGESSDEEFVDAVFGLVLRRPPDAEARERALTKLAEGTLSRASLLQELVTAEEFERVRQLDDVVAFARGARARADGPVICRPRRAPTSGSSRCPGSVAAPHGPGARGRIRLRRAGLHRRARRGRPRRLVGADLATAEVPGFETVVADARSLPFPDRSFDQVLLVSTLEHIGADNEVYGVDGEPDDSGRSAALRELRRILRPSGSLSSPSLSASRVTTAGSGRRTSAAGRASSPTPGSSSRSRRRTSWGRRVGARRRRSTRQGVVYGTRGPAASAVLCAELSPRRLRRLVSPDGVRRTARRRLGPSYRKLRGS